MMIIYQKYQYTYQYKQDIDDRQYIIERKKKTERIYYNRMPTKERNCKTTKQNQKQYR